MSSPHKHQKNPYRGSSIEAFKTITPVIKMVHGGLPTQVVLIVLVQASRIAATPKLLHMNIIYSSI